MQRLTIAATAALTAAAAGQTAFTYQGLLDNAGQPASGLHDLRFRAYTAASGGAQDGPTLCADNVTVADGVFSVTLDFGAIFGAGARFIEIEVRADTGLNCANNGGFTILAPRQAVTAAPVASFAAQAATASSASNAANLNGQAASFYLNASNLSSGTLPDARLASTIARLNTTQTFTGAITLSNAANAFTGAGAGLTSLNASNVASGTLADARLSTNIPRLNAAANFTAPGSFAAPFGIGTNAPTAELEVRDADPQFRLRNTNDTGGGVILNTFGSLQLGLYNPTGSAWGVVPANGYRAVLALNNEGKVGSVTNTGAGPAWRNMLDDGNGRLGIGTATPFAPVDVRFATNQHLFIRFDDNVAPCLNVYNTGPSAGILRVRNAIEVWPSDAGLRPGALDVRNAAGTPTITLDGATGNITFNNRPRASWAQTFRDPLDYNVDVVLTPGSSTIVDQIDVFCPSSGVVMVTASIHIELFAQTISANDSRGKFEFSLRNRDTDFLYNRAGVEESVVAFGGIDVRWKGPVALHWAVPVSAGETLRLKTGAWNYGNHAVSIWTTTLHGVFIPN